MHAKKPPRSSPARRSRREDRAGARERREEGASRLRSKAGRALTAFEPFGRDVERRYFSVTGRGGFELVASTESQACFGNAFLELLTAPEDRRRSASRRSASLRALCDKLLAEGVVSCFSLAPSDDVALATAFVFNGFRRTGLLQNHMVVGGARKDAIIWSRSSRTPPTSPRDERTPRLAAIQYSWDNPLLLSLAVATMMRRRSRVGVLLRARRGESPPRAASTG